MNIILFKTSLILATLTTAMIALVTAANADITSTSGTSRVLQEALATHDGMKIYDSEATEGLNLSGGLFSGRASGVDPAGINYASSVDKDYNTDHTAELEGDPRVHALLIDGSYNFDNHLGTGLPLHPYLTSGVGVAVYDHSTASAASLTSQGGSTVPLFRVGAGIAYKLGDKWNMSLDYKAGFSGGNNTNYVGSTQAIDMQTVNMGMHFQF